MLADKVRDEGEPEHYAYANNRRDRRKFKRHSVAWIE